MEAATEALRSAVASAPARFATRTRSRTPGRRDDVARRRCARRCVERRRDAALLDVVALVPFGPLSMSPDFEGLVELSTSLGEAITEGPRLTLHSLSRSSNGPLLRDVMAALDAAARLRAGARGQAQLRWVATRSRVADARRAGAVFRRVLGEEPIVTAVHAGLESAVIGDKVAQPLDMLSIGPQIEFPHSPTSG